MNIIKNNKGFTLLEFITALVIIAILTSLSTVGINSVRMNNRDSSRVSDILDIQGSLEMYYRDNGMYPTMITFGSAWAEGSSTYMQELPINPSPRTDGSCPDLEYEYSPDENNLSYHINFCLGSKVSDISTGINSATSEEVVNGDSFPTKLLMHFDNDITDTASGYVVTNNGVTFSSGTTQFGSHSGEFNGTSDYLSIPDSDDWNFGSDNFTIDFWVNFTRPTNNYFQLIKHQYAGSPYNGWVFDYENRDSSSGNAWYRKMVFRIVETSAVRITSTTDPSGAGWTHIALVRSGTTYTIYINGTAEESVVNTDDITADATLYIGANGTSNGFLSGYLDELRIVKGVAKWSSDFTSPTSAY